MPCCKNGRPLFCNINAVLKIFWTASLLLLPSVVLLLPLLFGNPAAGKVCDALDAMVIVPNGTGMSMPCCCCGCVPTGAVAKAPLKSDGACDAFAGGREVPAEALAGFILRDGVAVAKS